MRRRAPMRRTAMSRGAGPQRVKRGPVKQRSRDRAAEYAELRLVVYRRAGGRCERCGVWLTVAGMECHHRRLRSQGGRDAVVNLVALCPSCHHVEVHAQPERARAEGWIVPGLGTGPRVDPACVPVRLHDGRTVRLGDDGTYDVCWPQDGAA